MKIEDARKKMNMTRREVSEWLEIPYRTLSGWENGERACPDYIEKMIVEKIINRAEEKKGMKYYVIENRNIGTIGKPEFLETVIYTGTKEECARVEDEKRKEYKDRTVVDCFTRSEEERNKIEKANALWSSLTEEQKKETIIVNGKTYIKAIYEFNKNNEK